MEAGQLALLVLIIAAAATGAYLVGRGRGLKDMIDQIAAKYIRPDQQTLYFALMFIPAEPIYHRAILDQQIVDHATERSVMLVSPGTLFAYLSVIERGQKASSLMRARRRCSTVSRLFVMTLTDSVGATRLLATTFAEHMPTMRNPLPT